MAANTKAPHKKLDPQIKATDIYLTALEDEPGLSDWEREFLTSVSDWFYMKDRRLTPKQFDTLERIYKKFN